MIKAVLAFLAAALILAGAAADAEAASQTRKRAHAGQHKKHSPPRAYGYRKPASGNGSSDYYEHLLDKVPFGSQRWWQIYEETHGGPDG
jgi:hypothetical protein